MKDVLITTSSMLSGTVSSTGKGGAWVTGADKDAFQLSWGRLRSFKPHDGGTVAFCHDRTHKIHVGDTVVYLPTNDDSVGWFWGFQREYEIARVRSARRRAMENTPRPELPPQDYVPDPQHSQVLKFQKRWHRAGRILGAAALRAHYGSSVVSPPPA